MAISRMIGEKTATMTQPSPLRTFSLDKAENIFASVVIFMVMPTFRLRARTVLTYT